MMIASSCWIIWCSVTSAGQGCLPPRWWHGASARSSLCVQQCRVRWPGDVHRRHVQLVADLTGVAVEHDLMLQEARRHERVDRQLSIGAEIQAQLLPDHCPVIEGVDLAARCRPAFQVGGDYYDFIPDPPRPDRPPP